MNLINYINFFLLLHDCLVYNNRTIVVIVGTETIELSSRLIYSKSLSDNLLSRMHYQLAHFRWIVFTAEGNTFDTAYVPVSYTHLPIDFTFLSFINK